LIDPVVGLILPLRPLDLLSFYFASVRSSARYLWVVLLARIYEAFPLICPMCGAEMRIIAFITEAVDVRKILTHIGEPATPPRIASARGPPEWYEGSGEASIEAEDDPLVQPEPEYEFDQQVSG